MRGAVTLAALLGAVATTAATASADAAPSQPLPTVVGRCALTAIKWVGSRLEDEHGKPVPDAGSAVNFTNDGYQVSYDQVAAVDRSRRGDPVRLCLVSLPRNCPPGDKRGIVYKTTNLRTHRSWTLPDAEHMCGGA